MLELLAEYQDEDCYIAVRCLSSCDECILHPIVKTRV